MGYSAQRLRDRLHRRRPPADAASARLDRRTIRLRPTRDGLLFALVLGAMLLGAINYNNSLAYALTFLLASVGMLSILHAVRNLGGLQVTLSPCAAVFAGGEARLPIRIDNPGPRRSGVSVTLAGGSTRLLDIPARASIELELGRPATRRGRVGLGPVVLASRFPLGLVHARSRLHVATECLVYPHPEPGATLPPLVSLERGDAAAASGEEDFAGLHPYRRGDPLRRIDWKALARERGLQTKHFSDPGGASRWLSWEMTRQSGSVEPRLSRLCRWVLEADRLAAPFGLALPDARIGPGQGPAHRRRCLEALARFEAG